MSGLSERHRPLLSGINITSRTGNPLRHTQVGSGTLTGLATKMTDDGKEKLVLVTNLHVMAGLTPQDLIRNPTGDEKMFQGGDSYAHKVGSSLDWEPITLGRHNPNEIDLAICDLDENIDPWEGDELGAAFKLHDSSHSGGGIIRGTKEPEPDMDVILLGGITGEITGHIFDVGRTEYIGGAYFKSIFRVALDSPTKPGNSGSPILYKVEDGVYQMVGIHLAMQDEPRLGFAFTASAAERIMDIKFGNKPPVADAGIDQQVYVGTKVRLDGSGSKDPEGRGLTYRWDQDFGSETGAIADPGVSLNDNTARQPEFTAPKEPRVLKFNLTVTDVDGLSHTDSVKITVLNRPPVANAGPDQTVEPGSTVSLNASASSDPDGHDLDFEWEQQAGPTVSLSSTTVAEPTFTAPSVETTMTFRVTVTDIHDAAGSDTVTIRTAPETWGEWSRTGNYEGCGPDRQAEESRTSNYQNTETQWVADPEDDPWGPWTDTGDYSGCGPNRQKKQERTSKCGRSDSQWVAAPEPDPPGPWSDTGNHRGCGPDREKEQTRTSKCGKTETQWVVAPEPDPWGSWIDTNEYQGCGPDRQRKQTRTSKCGRSDSQWIDSPVAEVWGDWEDLNEYQGCGPDRQRRQKRTSNCGSVEYQWVDSPVAEVWGDWSDTDEYQGCGAGRERKQTSTSDCGNTQTQWVAAPESDPFGPWEDTDEYQGCGPDRERKQTSTSKCGRTQSQWVAAPESDPFGPWEDTDNYRGCGPDREREQTSTSKCGRTQTQWVAAAEALVWGKWKNLNEYRISPDDELIRQRKQERTDQCGNKETQWVFYENLPQSPVWSVWSDTGNYRGCGPTHEAERTRTSDQGETQTRWFDDPQPETWGNWIDTGEYRENPDTFITEYEQKRTSNCGNVEYRWSE